MNNPLKQQDSAEVDLVVFGLGYVGLPLVKRATEVGLRVVGVDSNKEIVNNLNAGHSHVDDLSDSDIDDMLAAGFVATTGPSVVRRADTVVVCVPTPLDESGGPDLGAVRSAMDAIATFLSPGTLVILESTTYPGTTDEEVRPMLEATGLTVGLDFYLAFSPERIDPGNPVYGLKNTPKIVGGCTPACTERAAKFYGRVVDEVLVAAGTREAEMAKLLENTYRHVNIALVNEMARFCHDLGIDLWDVIRCASSKPFGFQAFQPGPGVGGHCIPIDPNYLSHNVKSKLGYQFRFVELAQEINAGMPSYVVHRAQDLLNQEHKCLNGSKVLLLGVTYKANCADLRESPARPIAKQLHELGAEVVYHDPLVPEWSYNGGSLTTADDLKKAVKHADLTILLQAHEEYLRADLGDLSSLLLDTRGVLTGMSVTAL